MPLGWLALVRLVLVRLALDWLALLPAERQMGHRLLALVQGRGLASRGLAPK